MGAAGRGGTYVPDPLAAFLNYYSGWVHSLSAADRTRFGVRPNPNYVPRASGAASAQPQQQAGLWKLVREEPDAPPPLGTYLDQSKTVTEWVRLFGGLAQRQWRNRARAGRPIAGRYYTEV